MAIYSPRPAPAPPVSSSIHPTTTITITTTPRSQLFVTRGRVAHTQLTYYDSILISCLPICGWAKTKKTPPPLKLVQLSFYFLLFFFNGGARVDDNNNCISPREKERESLLIHSTAQAPPQFFSNHIGSDAHFPFSLFLFISTLSSFLFVFECASVSG